MTTNSPNTVDGDVQALIELAKRISNTPLKVISETVVCPGVYSSITSAEIHSLAKVALAALTAEPVEYLTWHQGCRAPDDCEIYSAVAKKGDKSDDGSDAIPVYTAPPAQLLRPVELPDERAWHEDDDAEDDSYNCGWNNGIKACAEALRQQGCEVKND